MKDYCCNKLEVKCKVNSQQNITFKDISKEVRISTVLNCVYFIQFIFQKINGTKMCSICNKVSIWEQETKIRKNSTFRNFDYLKTGHTLHRVHVCICDCKRMFLLKVVRILKRNNFTLFGHSWIWRALNCPSKGLFILEKKQNKSIHKSTCCLCSIYTI